MDRKDLSVKSVMTILPHSVGIDQNLATAKQMMHDYDIRHLPVQQGGELVGILSDRDISFLVAAEKQDAQALGVEDAYTADPYCVEPGEKVKVVAEVMAKERLGCCLIVEDGSLLGIFSVVDACKCLADLLE